MCTTINCSVRNTVVVAGRPSAASSLPNTKTTQQQNNPGKPSILVELTSRASQEQLLIGRCVPAGIVFTSRQSDDVTLWQDSVRGLWSIFRAADTDSSGTVSLDEMMVVLNRRVTE